MTEMISKHVNCLKLQTSLIFRNIRLLLLTVKSSEETFVKYKISLKTKKKMEKFKLVSTMTVCQERSRLIVFELN